jgi:hypothetical protein
MMGGGHRAGDVEHLPSIYKALGSILEVKKII